MKTARLRTRPQFFVSRAPLRPCQSSKAKQHSWSSTDLSPCLQGILAGTLSTARRLYLTTLSCLPPAWLTADPAASLQPSAPSGPETLCARHTDLLCATCHTTASHSSSIKDENAWQRKCAMSMAKFVHQQVAQGKDDQRPLALQLSSGSQTQSHETTGINALAPDNNQAAGPSSSWPPQALTSSSSTMTTTLFVKLLTC